MNPNKLCLLYAWAYTQKNCCLVRTKYAEVKTATKRTTKAATTGAKKYCILVLSRFAGTSSSFVVGPIRINAWILPVSFSFQANRNGDFSLHIKRYHYHYHINVVQCVHTQRKNQKECESAWKFVELESEAPWILTKNTYET